MCGNCVMESVVRSLSRRDLMKLTATAVPAAAAGPALAQPAVAGRPLGASTEIDIALDPPVSLTAQRMIDLTHTLDGSFPVIPVPGITFPFRQEVLTTLDRHGVFANSWTMIDHNGTHIDATNHFHPLGYALEEIPIRSLVVPLVVIDITERAAREAPQLYDMNVAGLGPLSVAEHFTMRNGRIARIRQVHDTAALRATMGSSGAVASQDRSEME